MGPTQPNFRKSKSQADTASHLITWEKDYQSEQDIPWQTLLAKHHATAIPDFKYLNKHFGINQLT